MLVSRGADKFLLSDLGPTLEQIKPTTVVIAGTFTNGAVLFTAFEAAARDIQCRRSGRCFRPH